MENFSIAGHTISPKSAHQFKLEVAQGVLSPVYIPVHVFHGAQKGPVLLLSAAIHGDEINGIEVIRRFLKELNPTHLTGTIIAAPTVNQVAFLNKERFFTDGHDLNRCFLKDFQKKTSTLLAYKVAQVFTQSLLTKATHIIDFHTASQNRVYTPHIRTDLSIAKNKELAQAFNTPLILNNKAIENSLRSLAIFKEKAIITFEGGGALKFSQSVITHGITCLKNTVRALGMLPDAYFKEDEPYSIHPQKTLTSSFYHRAATGGIFIPQVKLGQPLQKADTLGHIYDEFGNLKEVVKAQVSGIIIGKSTLPIVSEGSYLFHTAKG